MNQKYKYTAILIITAIVLFSLFRQFKQPAANLSLDYSEFLNMVYNENISEVTIQGDNISGFSSMGPFSTHAPEDPGLIKLLKNKGVNISGVPQKGYPFYMLLLSWLPMLLLIGVWVFFMRRNQSGGGGAFSFGKSRAKLMSASQKKITFNDVAGIDEAREELQEIIDFLKSPKKFTRLGGRIPKGILLVGDPGTGKTLLAKAIAGEAGVPFFSISGSDFVEMFIGVGASRVRDLFIQGKKNAPCIIFLDEIDAVGRRRGSGLGGGHDEKEQTLNQLLVEMDGFESNEGVILIAATNRPDVLDPALLRPGRFDRQIVVPVPDISGRIGILKVHSRKTPMSGDVDINILARGTPGFTGADIENMVNEAALMAARKNKESLEMADFEEARDKVMMGAARKSMVISDQDKKTTAYHEAGHALLAMLLPNTDPIHKVTIIPRGRKLGLTWQLPIDEKHIYQYDYLEGIICISMGSRVSEEIALNIQTTGAEEDIKRASDLARKMVCEHGMSENMGPLSYGSKDELIFLGRELTQQRDFSELTANMIDKEVSEIVITAYKNASQLIRNNLETLHRIANALLEKETLNRDEIYELMQGCTKTIPEVNPCNF
ncbi:MAG: ATP-dependent zinc metalloprotease FtsH [Deltaproteobacteria bacterium]|nr:ATP-dependent zinc metalloprotease FtsH [Deltaproteobacteria bacterium]